MILDSLDCWVEIPVDVYWAAKFLDFIINNIGILIISLAYFNNRFLRKGLAVVLGLFSAFCLLLYTGMHELYPTHFPIVTNTIKNIAISKISYNISIILIVLYLAYYLIINNKTQNRNNTVKILASSIIWLIYCYTKTDLLGMLLALIIIFDNINVIFKRTIISNSGQ